jgi:hypothetical protein
MVKRHLFGRDERDRLPIIGFFPPINSTAATKSDTIEGQLVIGLMRILWPTESIERISHLL